MTQNQITQYAPCPNCGSTDIKKVGYTWWGGALGPAMFTHVKCNNCNTQYNGKTGKSNQNSIIIYVVVSFVLVFCVCGGFAILSAILNNSH
jgi:transposase-like protein